jgi:hypothetical protein
MTRIELHDAKWVEDYNKLHLAMQEAGFSKTIKGSNGSTYELPTAEYYLDGNYELQDVLSMGKKAATTVGKKYSIITSQTINSTWDFLPIKK